MKNGTKDYISFETAGSLYGLFRERVRRTPDAVAYRYFNYTDQSWETSSWQEMAIQVARWQQAISKLNDLKPGDRVAIMLKNCREWAMFDQAALSLGLVSVPIFTDDRAGNIAYILNDSGAKLLFFDDKKHWKILTPVLAQLTAVKYLICRTPLDSSSYDARLMCLNDWLPNNNHELLDVSPEPDSLASIVYTSGTTGNSKGVMLSHRNILWDVWSGLQSITIYREDLFLSFLPLSHMLERTAGYYMPMLAGASVAYSRSINDLPDDFLITKPTVLISVPRIFERVYNEINKQLRHKSAISKKLFKIAENIGWNYFLYKQNMKKWEPVFLFKPIVDFLIARKISSRLGGRLRFSICGGAALPFKVAKMFISFGINLAQGYGLTETSPVLSVNKLEYNDPMSVGEPLLGVNVKIVENDELIVKAPNVMLGYWNMPGETSQIIDKDGWLHTGDKAEIKAGRIYITGRLKDVLVLSNGEKISPVDMENAISMDPLFEQVLVIGDAKPFLSALVVINQNLFEELVIIINQDTNSTGNGDDKINNYLLDRIKSQTQTFPGYARICKVSVCIDTWTIERNLITPTLKLKRNKIIKKYNDEIMKMYEGH